MERRGREEQCERVMVEVCELVQREREVTEIKEDTLAIFEFGDWEGRE